MAERITRRLTDDDREIARRVWERRRALNLSRMQVGDALKIAHQQIHKYENAINRIPAGRLKEIAKLFDTPIEWFFRPAPTGNKKAA